MTTGEQLELGAHWAENAPLAEAFRTFDRANPHVYAELARLTDEWLHRRGASSLGLKMLWEVMRWNLALTIETDEPFKLNNNYTSFYARKLMAHKAGVDGLFKTRGRDETCECCWCVVGS